MTGPRQPTVVQNSGQVLPAGHEPANLGDILERVLDRGLVIAGDIRVSLLDIELLTLKLRLVIASVDTARQMGIDWWEHDPFLSSRPRRPIERDPRREELSDRSPYAADRYAGPVDEAYDDEGYEDQPDDDEAADEVADRAPSRRRMTGRGATDRGATDRGPKDRNAYDDGSRAEQEPRAPVRRRRPDPR